MKNPSKTRFRAVILAVLLLAAIVASGVSTAFADGMTGDPPAERTATTTGPITDAETIDVIDIILLLATVL